MSVLCRLHGVTRAGFYAWRNRGESKRVKEDRELLEQIVGIYENSKETYGSPRIFHSLKANDISVSAKRVARIMRENGIKARSARLYRPNPGHHEFCTNIENSACKKETTALNQVWVGDLTYLRVGTAWRYLSVVMDKCSRRVIGWSLSKNKDTKLTLSALNRAAKQRKTESGVIFHSDRGIEYAAFAFRNRLKRLGITQSMNRPRTMNDNAHMESFFHSFKSDCYHGNKFHTEHQLRKTIESYIPFYNNRRLHSALGYISPVQFELQM